MNSRQQILLGHLNPQFNGQFSTNDQPMFSMNYTSAISFQDTNATSSTTEIVDYTYCTKNPEVVIFTMKSQPVNSLSQALLGALQQRFQQAYQDKKCKAIVIRSAIPGFFVAGADIPELQKLQSASDSAAQFKKFIQANNDFLNGIESGSKPVVAAIDGNALGGGLELAMGCNSRVCSPKSSLGLPELKLGVIPGFGGTQRLPRLVGVKKAAEMMLTSAPVKGTEAQKIGLVDDCVPSDTVVARASDIAMEMATGKRSKRVALYLNTRLEKPEQLTQIFGYIAGQAKKSAHLPHVQACINAIKAGVESNGRVGLDTETKEFTRVATGDVAKSLIYFFLASKATSKIPGLSSSIKPRPIKSVAVLGGGTMGSGIVIGCLSAGMKVILKEVNQQFLDAGVKRVKDVLDGRLQRGKLTQQQYDQLVANLKPQITYDGFDKLDMVIEAVIEKIDLKQSVFAELEKVCSPTCILGTNTSSISLKLIGEKTKAQKRIIGLHYFAPAHVMPLLEVIRTDEVDPQILADVMNFCKQIQKTPIVVGNCPGFVVNRLLYRIGQAAGILVERGIDPYRIDKVMYKYGLPTAVFRLFDLTGIDVTVYAFGVMADAFGENQTRVKVSQLMVQAGRLGEKTGKGFYNYATGKPEPDPETAKYVAEAIKIAGNPSKLDLTDEQIVEYLIYPTVNEACRLIQEGMVYRPSDIDIGAIFATGYPAWRGGYLKYGDTVGAKEVAEKLQQMSEATGVKSFEPVQYLKDCASQGRSLLSGMRQ